jgi:hypothetical protein
LRLSVDSAENGIMITGGAAGRRGGGAAGRRGGGAPSGV